jgi:hypothetical protein
MPDFFKKYEGVRDGMMNAAARLGARALVPPDLKFLQRLLQTRSGTSNRKAALES